MFLLAVFVIAMSWLGVVTLNRRRRRTEDYVSWRRSPQDEAEPAATNATVNDWKRPASG